MISDLMERADESVRAIRAESSLDPRVAIVLGTGLAGVVSAIDVEATIAYSRIPGFVEATVEGHAGRLVLGRLEDVPVAAMQGRPHGYEGYSLQEVTYPIRVLRRLGAETLVVLGTTGGLNPEFQAGRLVLLDDHINLLGDNPLVGPNDARFGPRFPDMSEPYDSALQRLVEAAAADADVVLGRGVYAAVPGPSLETRAEYRMLRTIGADVVGMSTVPEVIVARHMGMRVVGLTVVTDCCTPDALEPVDYAEILDIATGVEPDMTRLVAKVVSQL